MKTLIFTQIVDSRFDTKEQYSEQTKQDLFQLIKKRNEKIITLFENVCGVDVEFDEPRLLDWNNHYQYRQDYRIKKTTRKITWNDIYGMINTIKPVPYKFS